MSLSWHDILHIVQISSIPPVSEPSIDQGPYVNVAEDGMIAAVSNEPKAEDVAEDSSELHKKIAEMAEDSKEQLEESVPTHVPSIPEQASSTCNAACQSATSLIKRRLDQLSRYSRRSMWLLAYVAILTSWPLVGSAVYFLFKRKIKSVSPSTLQKR